jgi:hypothetical protein
MNSNLIEHLQQRQVYFQSDSKSKGCWSLWGKSCGKANKWQIKGDEWSLLKYTALFQSFLGFEFRASDLQSKSSTA